jgi:hypothetical protein
MEPIASAQGEMMAQSIGAGTYIGCCAPPQCNLNDVFDASIKLIFHPPSSICGPADGSPDVGGCVLLLVYFCAVSD